MAKPELSSAYLDLPANTPSQEDYEKQYQDMYGKSNSRDVDESLTTNDDLEDRPADYNFDGNASGKAKEEAYKKQEENIQKAKEEAKSGDDKKKNPNNKPEDLGKAMDKMMGGFFKTMGVDYNKVRAENVQSMASNANIYNSLLSSMQGNQSLNLDFTRDSIPRIFGLPYQYMDIADRRIPSDSKYGRKYLEKIASKMPLLILTPGVPRFMGSFTDEEKKAMFSNLLDGTSNFLNNITGSTGQDMRYYSLQFEAVEYFKYVNAMVRAISVFLGVNGDEFVGNQMNMSIGASLGSVFSRANAYYGGIAFYLNSETQISESFGNETTKSILADKINQMSDIGREIQFLTGISGTGVDFFMANNLTKDGENKDKLIKNAKPGTFGGFLNMITSGVKTVFAGGKLVFPELWADSSYSNNYNVNIKLVSPDYDKRSWLANIGIPLVHLIALCSPRQVGANGYISPFLVRAYYKGFFNIDMGIVSMSVQKGSEGGWTVDGLPTTVEVNLEIRDLYSKLTISKEGVLDNNEATAFNNIALLSYLANMCGVNINEPDLQRSVALFTTLKGRSVLDVPNQITSRITQTVNNIILRGFDFGKMR